MMKKVIVLLIYILGVNFYAQEEELIIKDSTYIYGDYIIFSGDSILIELEEVRLLNKLNFKSDYDRNYYYWFRKKTLKAYPYAKLAAERLEVLNRRLEKIKSKSKSKRYTKKVQKYMEGEFTDQLKKLTRTEGRILIKLIHRQTGITTFGLIKEIRSGWNAFWYNNTAKLFKLSLKLKYNPANNNEDFIIEDILQRAFIDGILEKQTSKLDFDYHELSLKNKNLIYIEK
tara:strand:+ start:3317 stop:4003 length:687 start_codon:yes stop_codon:yes gene_type:complete